MVAKVKIYCDFSNNIIAKRVGWNFFFFNMIVQQPTIFLSVIFKNKSFTVLKCATSSL